jgi:transposase-like protein
MMLSSNSHKRAAKVNAVRRIIENGESLRQVAADMAVSMQILQKWLAIYATPVAHESSCLRLKTPADDLRELRQEREELRQEREFFCVKQRSRK